MPISLNNIVPSDLAKLNSKRMVIFFIIIIIIITSDCTKKNVQGRRSCGQLNVKFA